MKKKNYIILPIILVLSYFSFNAFSQSYEEDTLAVRAILDANGLVTESVESVTDLSKGRIINLKLFFKNLSSLPSEIGNLKALEGLYLSNNSLRSLPPEIGNLTNLKEFYLDSNNLTTLPGSIIQITSVKSNLIDCDLSNNKLCSLSPAIKTWANKYDPDWESNQDCQTEKSAPGLVGLAEKNGAPISFMGLKLGMKKSEVIQILNIIGAKIKKETDKKIVTKGVTCFRNNNPQEASLELRFVEQSEKLFVIKAIFANNDFSNLKVISELIESELNITLDEMKDRNVSFGNMHGKVYTKEKKWGEILKKSDNSRSLNVPIVTAKIFWSDALETSLYFELRTLYDDYPNSCYKSEPKFP